MASLQRCTADGCTALLVNPPTHLALDSKSGALAVCALAAHCDPAGDRPAGSALALICGGACGAARIHQRAVLRAIAPACHGLAARDRGWSAVYKRGARLVAR